MNAPQCTLRSPGTQPAAQSADAPAFKSKSPTSCLFELRVPLDELFRATSGEAHGYAAVFVVALDANDGSDAEARMTNLAAQHGIGIAAALRSGAPEGSLSRLAARSCLCLLRCAAHPTQKFLRGIRILRVGLVAARFANFRH